jgi:phage gp29-like protein
MGMGDEMNFTEDVKPLFREEDRSSMDFAFDLWSYDDVKANADLILQRVEDGTMPCDESWSEDKLQVLRSWIDAGCPP